jgi:CubicO group peptidase (beta-lactamase class C family)
MMYGRWVRRGIIDLSATLKALGIDDLQGLSEREQAATLRHLISARSGVYHPASNFSGVTEEGPKRGDQGPGEYYWYNNWDFNAAGGIFEQLTGSGIYEAFDEQLARPLGLQDFDLTTHIENGKTGNLGQSKFPAYHFFLSARDLARLGLLMLRGGEWNGEQVLPPDWIVESTSIITPNTEINPPKTREKGFAYGYMWWIFDPERFPEEYHGGYAARGHYGQYIIVLPAVDVVIAHKTLGEDYETPEEYEAINVTWEEMRVLIDLVLAAM